MSSRSGTLKTLQKQFLNRATGKQKDKSKGIT